MRSDRWLGPVIVLVALAWLALVYTYIPGASTDVEPGPRGFPILLGASLFGVGVLMTVSAFVARHDALAGSDKPVTRREATIVAGTFGLLMLYAFLMERAGFLISTPIAVLLMMYGLLQMRNWILMALMATGITGTCWLLFVKVLGVPLPQGSWLWHS
jgi:putative tricarboxylic transport membrane protein